MTIFILFGNGPIALILYLHHTNSQQARKERQQHSNSFAMMTSSNRLKESIWLQSESIIENSRRSFVFNADDNEEGTEPEIVSIIEQSFEDEAEASDNLNDTGCFIRPIQNAGGTLSHNSGELTSIRDRTGGASATSAFIVNRTVSRDNIESRDSNFSKRNSPLAKNNRISRMQNQIIQAITTRDEIP